MPFYDEIIHQMKITYFIETNSTFEETTGAVYNKYFEKRSLRSIEIFEY